MFWRVSVSVVWASKFCKHHSPVTLYVKAVNAYHILMVPEEEN